MKSRRRLASLTAAALLIAIPAGWYFGSPWWTLWRIREAARAGDLAALAGYVDFPRVAAAEKRGAKRWLVTALETPMRDMANPRRFVAFARRKLGEIERGSFPSPMDLRAALAGMEVGHGLLGPIARRRGDPYVIHHGLDRFEVRDRGMSREHGPVFAFERRGLGWRLVAVRWGQQ